MDTILDDITIFSNRLPFWIIILVTPLLIRTYRFLIIAFLSIYSVFFFFFFFFFFCVCVCVKIRVSDSVSSSSKPFAYPSPSRISGSMKTSKYFNKI